jgi:site-specific recombinase XerD
MERVKMPKVPETVVPTFTQKEIDRLLAQPNKLSNQGFRDYAILLTFIDTGTRLSELAGLKIKMILRSSAAKKESVFHLRLSKARNNRGVIW